MKIKFRDSGRCLVCLHNPCDCKIQKELTESNLKMFLKLSVFGLKMNPNYPGLGAELEKSFKEIFGKELVDL